MPGSRHLPWLRRPAAAHPSAFRRTALPVLLSAALGGLLPSCDPPPPASSNRETHPLARQLAGAWHDAARERLSGGRPAEAVLLLVASLKADPEFTDSLRLLRIILAETKWSFPDLSIDCGYPVEQALTDGLSLWTSIAEPGGFTTTARWNLESLRVESVLFPRPAESTRTLALSPDRSRVVVTRAKDGWETSLLCDAATLRPVATLHDAATPTAPASPVFSEQVPLFAAGGETSGTITWTIRDLASGEILRSQEIPARPAVQAGSLSRTHLRLHLEDHTLLSIPVAPVEEVSLLPSSGEPSPATAVAARPHIDGAHIAIPRTLPLPKTTGRDPAPLHFASSRLPGLVALAEALTGYRFDENNREFSPLNEAERRSAAASCAHPDTLLDGLDFTPVIASIAGSPSRTSPPDAAFLLRDRISRANSSPPRFLALGNTTAPEQPSPAAALEEIFRTGNPEDILAAIRESKSKPTAAHAFRLALESSEPAWISAALETHSPLPRLLSDLAISRFAWLSDRKPEAIGVWKDGFPDMKRSRRTEDWNGWESTDFAPILQTHIALLKQEIDSFHLAEADAPESRETITERLLNPETTSIIGREKHAAACLDAAEKSAELSEESDTCLKLLTFAKLLGASPIDCLRVEAAVHTTAGDFFKSRDCWVSLITDFPAESHDPGDYTEAAYTAFECGEAEQSMAILTTGLARFPDDHAYSYRAGWIALLTGHDVEAYEFLMNADRIGFPDDIFEKALALISIASARTGHPDQAEACREQLLDLNPAWAGEAPPGTENWPPDLLMTLHSIGQPPKAVPIIEE